jgi:amino acid adenylation domain-containing protein
VAAPPRLWVVTSGAQPADGGVSAAGCAQAALWGLVRTAAMEHHELRPVRIDIDPAAAPARNAAFICDEIAAGGLDDEVAVRGERRLVPRLAKLSVADRDLAIRADRTYLITGGLGGLGLTTAEWLVGRGARHVVLMGRGAPDEPAGQRIQSWRHAGADVRVLACDVSDADALAGALASARALAPLGGVIHCAGTLADGTLANQTWESLRRVFAAKVYGAWNLHQLTLDDPLELFVLYASTAGILGSPGQGNYAAANAFLDALAWHRRGMDRPALAIDWGAWSGVGMAARHARGDRAATRGIRQIDSALGMRVLERLLPLSVTQAAVAPIDWTTFANQFPAGGVPGVLAELVEAAPRGRSSGTAAAGAVRARIAAAAGDRHAVLIDYILDRLAQVLDTPVDQLDPSQPVNTLGLDSLMALDLRHRFKTDLDLDVPVTMLLSGLSATTVASRIQELSDRAPVAAPATIVDAVHPLTYGQRALWFLHRAAPESSAYNTAIAVRIGSAVDADTLERAFGKLILRHDALRTTITNGDGAPAQQVWGFRAIPLGRHDVSGWNDDALGRGVRAAYARPFDLERGPLARLDLLTRDRDDHVLLLTLHHIVGDAWSLWILLDELLQVYRGEMTGREPRLPDVTPFAGFARRQAAWLASAAGDAAWQYWKATLAGALPTIDLPADRPRPPAPSYAGASLDVVMTAELTSRLRDVARRHGVTLYVLLLACIQVLLRRVSGQDDVVLGTLASGRTDPAFAETVGYFVNPVVIRTAVQGDDPFAALLARVREQALRAMDHQDFPFSLLVERLQPRREPSRSPVFQVLFVLQKAPSSHAPAAIQQADAVATGELRLEPFPFPQMEGQFDLTLEVTDAEPLRGVLRYSAELFERDTTVRLADQFLELLGAVCDDPGARVDDITPIPAAEAQQLAAWNATTTAFPEDVCIHRLIEDQVDRTPDAIAVVFEGRQWTYREVNDRAAALAAQLRTCGAGPETLVGLCMERSLELVVSILAVLKAGAAYVPLDPDYPRDRLEFMTQDADVAILLTGAAPPRVERVSAARRSEEPTPDNLAYVIYTSGSTGRPKGAMNTHRGLCNRIAWMQSAYRLDASDAVLQKTPFSFDVSVWEFLWPLTTGARLVVCRPGGHQDPRYLAAIIREQNVTTLHFVPSMLRAFLEQSDLESLPSLRRVICSGEALPPELAQRALRVLGAELHNLYGPTEASIDVTAWRCLPGDDAVPIGAPIANTQIHIVDRLLNACPIGVAGELCIGGVNVGRGYHARPDLTADRFVPDPFGPPGSRMYRTGDLARWRADGEVIYLGRLDTQVKIRGFRIELGEIDARLAEHSEIRDAAVVARAGADGDTRLIAYVVAEQTPPSTTQLHRFLRETLPDYMVPAAFVWLPALPLSPNGKLDRRALPDPPTDRPRLDSEFAAPATGGEHAIAAVWRDVLRLDRIGIHDNFFELGGQSLLLAQAHARLQQDVAPALTLVDMFQHPTVHLLARHVGNGASPASPPDDARRAGARGDRAADVAERRRARLGHRHSGAPQP